MQAPAPPIEDYALIGDCRSAALVSRSGSIDWLCLPNFSDPSLFAAILDTDRGGRFAITPAQPFTVSRRYAGESAIVESVYRTETGALRVTDAMIIGDSPCRLEPMREIVRIVDGLEGTVPVDIVFDPRPDYGRRRERASARGAARICRWGSDIVVLRTDSRLGSGDSTRIRVNAGQRLTFSLSYSHHDIAVLPPVGDQPARRMERTRARWAAWSSTLAYAGPYSAAVRRSALALKLMTFTLSGAVVAAPTTSLPEWIGSDRNWDYRYCWLRDAALTMRAFISLGLAGEAAAFLRWLLHATALTRPKLSVMYDIFGRTRLKERELGRLAGYRDSRPVRIGNGAYLQRQLDVYGAVIAAAAEYVLGGGTLQADQRRLLAGFGEMVCRSWREPDQGMWEVRGEARHHTFSKLMCWVALDWLLKLDRMIGLRIDSARFESERDRIEAAIDTDGFDAGMGCYVGIFGGNALDAALLLMPCVGYKPPDDPRLRATLDRIEERLGDGPYVYRYERGADGLDAPEGAFGLCSFWRVEALARIGETERARGHFERLLGKGSDLGLYAEEIDPASGAALGNFPQAFTHVGLINAAVAIGRAETAGGRP